MEQRKSCLYDVMTLDLGTLGGLLGGMEDELKSPQCEQLVAAQYVLQGIYAKLEAIRKRYGFEVDMELFEHQVHEFGWKIVLPEKEETPTDSESQ